MERNYYYQHNIGKCRHCVNFHDGKSTHKDGSSFYDIRIFSRWVDAYKFIRELQKDGYVER